VRILVCGSRGFDVYRIVVDAMENVIVATKGDVIVEGCARGADRLGELYALNAGLILEHHPADWEKYGRRAGFLRNVEMVESGIAVVAAFWDGTSKGTKHTIAQATARGIPVEVFSL